MLRKPFVAAKNARAKNKHTHAQNVAASDTS